jgi:hypothetical protein
MKRRYFESRGKLEVMLMAKVKNWGESRKKIFHLPGLQHM